MIFGFRGFEYFVIIDFRLNNKVQTKINNNERRERVKCSLVEAITFQKGNEAMNFINSFAVLFSVKWMNEKETEILFRTTKFR